MRLFFSFSTQEEDCVYLGGGVGGAPAQGDSGLQVGAQLLEDGTSEVGSVGEAGVEDHVGGGVAQAEVALGHSRLGQVEASLVSGEPALGGQ